MENRFEHFTLDIFNISKYWNKIASEEMKEYGLRGAHALYLMILDGYEGEMTAARLADLCQRLASAFARLEASAGFLERTLNALARLRPTLSIDPGDTIRWRYRGTRSSSEKYCLFSNAVSAIVFTIVWTCSFVSFAMVSSLKDLKFRRHL